jgi:hypothetical protein
MTNPDENYNSNNYMSAGSRVIMEQKTKAEELYSQKKSELFQKYGGKAEEVSMVDFYLQSQSKNSFVTKGIQKFEDSVITAM